MAELRTIAANFQVSIVECMCLYVCKLLSFLYICDLYWTDKVESKGIDKGGSWG